jgi:hypothetical protein
MHSEEAKLCVLFEHDLWCTTVHSFQLSDASLPAGQQNETLLAVK